MTLTQYTFTFFHGMHKKAFGPYETLTQAQEAFQRAYGYWPNGVISTVSYHSGV